MSDHPSRMMNEWLILCPRVSWHRGWFGTNQSTYQVHLRRLPRPTSGPTSLGSPRLRPSRHLSGARRHSGRWCPDHSSTQRPQQCSTPWSSSYCRGRSRTPKAACRRRSRRVGEMGWSIRHVPFSGRVVLRNFGPSSPSRPSWDADDDDDEW